MSENESIHFGENLNTGEPEFVPLSLFRQHTLIKGMTGAMKGVFTTYIALQLIEKTDASVVIVDFGGDKFMFHAVCRKAKELGRKFRFLATRPANAAWEPFYPLQSVTPLSEETLPLATSFLTTALSLSYGEGFSLGYFGATNEVIVEESLEMCLEDGILRPDFRELAERAYKVSKRYRASEISEVVLQLKRLRRYPQLAVGADTKKRISVKRALKKGEVLYASLKCMSEPVVRKIGAMLAWSVAFEAERASDRGRPLRPVYLIVDEFGASVAQSKAFQDMLVLSRKFGVHLVLICQSFEQLRGNANTTDMRPLLDDNTAVKLFLTCRGNDVEALQDASHDTFKRRGARLSVHERSLTTSIGEVYDRALERNDILSRSARSGEGFLVRNITEADDGHLDPIPVRFSPLYYRELFTPEVHGKLSHTKLPTRKRAERAKPKPRKEHAMTPERQSFRASLSSILKRERDAAIFTS